MTIPIPNLDDRTFDDLLAEARQRIRHNSPDWTDFSPSDPGMVLVELFAYLTESMIYRLNRVPSKVYAEFLNLIGVKLVPPAAASVTLRCTWAAPGPQPVTLPRGTRVAAARSEGADEPPVFVTAAALTLSAEQPVGEVTAYHAEPLEGELVGVGSGLPGLVVQARRPPLVAGVQEDLAVVVAVEVGADELEERAPALQFEGKTYRIWREVASFAQVGDDPYVYRLDRVSGSVTFAPAVRDLQPAGELAERARSLAAIPGAGRAIRLWYWRGGGPRGNVAAHTLTLLKDPIPGVAVTNPLPASGGQAAETVENALVRGPQSLHSLEAVITARDFENVALLGGRGVARAKAITQAALWKHAQPGTVELLLVPSMDAAQRGPGQVTVAALRSLENETVRAQIRGELEQRRALGTACVVSWARYKPVRVGARIVVRRQENREAVRRRVLERLHGLINPLPNAYNSGGWPFGQALRVSHIYDAALAEPGVQWADRVRLEVREIPQARVVALRADAFQPQTWYAGSGANLFRSVNDGEGWELAAEFPGEEIRVLAVHPQQAGLLAVVTVQAGTPGARVYLSGDCGESWGATPTATAFGVNDAAWTLRDGAALLLLATDVGLYELSIAGGGGRPHAAGSPLQVLVDSQNQDLGFYAVAAAVDGRGQVSVAAAAQGTRGVFLSGEGGRRNTFQLAGLQGEDIRTLAVQADGPRTFLWAGAAAAGPEDTGKGCFRWELMGAQNPPDGWVVLNRGWQGGSCRGLAFARGQVLAASHRGGVLRLNPGEREPAWTMPDVRCGLPLRDPGRFHPVDTVAAGASGAWIMAGGVEGALRSRDLGIVYERATRTQFTDRVTLPPTWLFCSDEHSIEVVSEDEAERD